MEKKIEVEINGRKVRIMPHMLKDAVKFGATQEKKVVKETPKELLRSPLPEMTEVPKTVVTETKTTAKTETTVIDPLPKVRKTPVRSKAKK